MAFRRWNRNVRQDSGRTRTADERLYKQLRDILRGASSRDQAESRIAAAVKDFILPRPQDCQASVTWSSDPHQRSAWVVPGGHPVITVDTTRVETIKV